MPARSLVADQGGVHRKHRHRHTSASFGNSSQARTSTPSCWDFCLSSRKPCRDPQLCSKTVAANSGTAKVCELEFFDIAINTTSVCRQHQMMQRDARVESECVCTVFKLLSWSAETVSSVAGVQPASRIESPFAQTAGCGGDDREFYRATATTHFGACWRRLPYYGRDQPLLPWTN